jgi:hypothetical protein
VFASPVLILLHVVVLQTLWHVSVFRNAVLRTEVPSNTLLGIMRDTFLEYKVCT